MSQIVKNIAIYLTPKLGDSSDWKLILTIYESNHAAGGFPQGGPLAIAEREVSDITKEGWYVFDFGSVELDSGYYCMVLSQIKGDLLPDEDFFNKNFVEWVHSSDTDTNKNVFSFSSDYGFTTFPSGGNAYTDSYVYGYGYGYGLDDPLDYFNVLGFEGDLLGYGLGLSPDQIQLVRSYAYGFEYVTLISEPNVKRNFKVYSEFNDITFVDVFDFTDQENNQTVFVNLPSGEEDILKLSNRQDFIIAEKNNVDILGNYISLSDTGKRIYNTDITAFSIENLSSFDVDWFESNFFLSSNSVNYADIVNPLGNTDRATCWLASVNYFSGSYFSSNSGSTWKENVLGLELGDGSVRNLSCIKFDPSGDYAIAFDNSSSSEKGKVYAATISKALIDSNSVSWSLINSSDFGSGGLKGLVVNDAIFFSEDEVWVGTDNGVYRSIDKGVSWGPINNGLPSLTVVNQISGDFTSGSVYGYGYGYGSGLDYFDVLGESGYYIGYGVGGFESSFANSYGYGYGYEYTSEGDESGILIFIATENGIYRYISGEWSQVGSSTISQANTVLLENNKIYVGSNEGFFRSSDEQNIVVDDLTFEGTSEFDEFYAQGLLRNTTTRILSNSSNSQELFVSQHGGVFVSSNAGGNFTNISNKLEEKRVKFILLNPLNNNSIYAFTESTKFSNAALTLMIDCSGSMVSNDLDDNRIDMAKNIINDISSFATSTPFYQLIRFGLADSDYQKIKNYAESRGLDGDEFSVSGIVNITEGFTSSQSFVTSQLDALKNIEYYGNKTPLNDAIDLISKSLNSGGSDFSYVTKEYEYEVGSIVSKRFNESDKILIIITDGFNSTIGKTLEYITREGSEFNNLRSKIYLISVGQNINYEYLNSLADSRENIFLYNSGFNENLETEIANIILEKEKFRKRNGVWKKTIKYDTFRKIIKSEVIANVPENTDVSYRVRSSRDKDVWSDWVEGIDVNIDKDLDLFGKYFQIEISIESIFPPFSPEIKEINITSINPKESYLFYKAQDTDGEKEISDIYLNSIDDVSLGNFSDEDMLLDFGFLESDSTNFNFYDKLSHGTRSIVKRKEWENLVTEDGFFYEAEGGGWAQEKSIAVYDATDGIQDLSEPISSSRYFVIPSLGRVIFYEKQPLNREFKLRLTNSNSVYRIGTEFLNYRDSDISFRMHDISWMYYDDPRESTVQRDALPLVASQLGDGDVFGQVNPSFIPSSQNQFSTISAQYINRSENIFSNGILSLSNGLRIDISTDDSVENYIFYKQNAFLPPYNVEFSSSENYVSIDKMVDNISVSSDSDFYQINLLFSSSFLNPNESVSFVVGDTSLGGVGYSTYLTQSNLLFDGTEQVIGELETTFIIGDSNSVTSAPSASSAEGSANSDSPAHNTSFDGFDKPLSPSVVFGASAASKGYIIAPTTVRAGAPFEVNILAIDTIGLIDKNYTGSFTLSFENSSFGSFDSSYEFVESDNGTKAVTVTTNSNVSGVARIILTFNDIEITSNPILVRSLTSIGGIYWGDLNVSSIHSDGRQSIEFISDYARRIGSLDFVGIADDLSSLSQDEWDFIKFESGERSDNEIIVIPGVRHRSEGYFGERVILFENLDDIPSEKPTDPSDLSGTQAQIQSIVSDTRDYDSITFPVHTPYENGEDEIFSSRGFDFDNYREIISYSPVSDSEDFVSQKEVAVEIYSEHGGLENNLQFVNNNFLVNQSSQYLAYALQMGKKFAFIANSGGYSSRPGYYTGDQSDRVALPSISNGSNRGLTAISVNSLSRESIFSAIRRRRTYATTGARIYLEFNGFYGNNSIPMGTHYTQVESDSSSGTPLDEISFSFRIISDKSNISRIQIVKIEVDNFVNNKNILDTFSGPTDELNLNDFGTDTGILTFTDTEIESQGVAGKEFCYYLKAIQFDGHVAWSSPIWFDFGREGGIRSTQQASQSEIFKVSLVENSSNSNNFGFVRGAPQKDSVEGFPINHLDIITTRPNFDPKDSRVTPYETSEDDPISLMVSDRRCVYTGFRVVSYSDFNLFYGTHFMRVLREEADYKSENIISLNDSEISVLNGDTVQTLYDEKFKFLNTDYNSIENERLMRYRDWFFGTVWQYTSTGSFRTGYSLDQLNIFAPQIPDAFIARDPFIYRDGSDYLMFYSGYSGKYPLQTEIANGENVFGTSPILGGTNLLRDINKREEFVGLLNTNSLDPLSGGENIRIMYATDDGLNSREFLKRSVIPNTFSKTENGNLIYYSYSPNYIKVSDTDHRIYYLGWFYGRGSDLKPVLGLFCYRFSDIDNISSSGDNVLCFAFTGDSSRLPQSYRQRDCSFEANNFYPQDIRSETVNNSDFWFRDHPVYGSRWYWLSVAQQDNGDFYAFFNYLNRIDENTFDTDENIYSGQDNPGTGILFSTDTDKLLFREFDSTGTSSVPPLAGKVFFHPFKFTENSQSNWYSVYRNIDSTSTNLSEEIFYARFNWIPSFFL